MKKLSKNNKLQIRNSTAEFLTFAYQSKGDGKDTILVEDVCLNHKMSRLGFYEAARRGQNMQNIAYLRHAIACGTLIFYQYLIP